MSLGCREGAGLESWAVEQPGGEQRWTFELSSLEVSTMDI
jgi:hypothetical protein